ncbi:hypothetical protein [Larkinella rosea]|uniref:Uncharacterized protein n=1 Tax=Larkinella rosea TaxID=2025312 RepID=A0A3P1BJ13_9BACT|nr:hypothetical protein [Larkinella rosea]RRB01081.1 hypothetical protein EHT25_23180 [Larkinella rosea]
MGNVLFSCPAEYSLRNVGGLAIGLTASIDLSPKNGTMQRLFLRNAQTFLGGKSDVSSLYSEDTSFVLLTFYQ